MKKRRTLTKKQLSAAIRIAAAAVLTLLLFLIPSVPDGGISSRSTNAF